MSLLFAGTSAANGFDSSGHYVRAEPLVGGCTTYDIKPILGCSANFGGPGTRGCGEREQRDPAGHASRHEQEARFCAARAAEVPDRERRMNLRRRERGALSNPILIGALTVLVAVVAVTLAYNANNGLPFVPKYDLHLKVARRERGHARRRGAHGRRADRDRRQDPADARPRRRADRADGPQAQQGGRAAPGRFDVRRPAQGRDRPQVHRGDPRHLEPDLAERGHRAAVAIGLGGRSRPVPVDVRPGDAGRRGGIDDRLQRRAGRTRQRHQRRDRGVQAAGHPTSARSPATWPRRKPISAASGAAWSRSRGRWCRSPRTRPTCTATSTPRSRALSTVAVPFLQDWISTTPPTFESVIDSSPRLQSFVNDTAGAVRRAAARVRDAPAERAGARRRVRRRDQEPARHDRARPAPDVAGAVPAELRRRPPPSSPGSSG